MKEVYLYKKLSDKRVQCRNCSHYCQILPAKRGLCGVRENIDGKLFYSFPKTLLKELYEYKKIPMEKISKILKTAPSAVWKYLHKYNIPVRKYKYKKYDFSTDPREKAYILGLAAGDIYVHKHCRQIAAELTTTHPAMMDLFYSVFEKYGSPTSRIKYNRKTERHEWAGNVFLNNTFEFMLSENLDIDNEYFYHFLAGFFDSEGCVHIYDNHGYAGLSVLIYNSDKELLDIIKKRLEKDGFHPKFYKFFKKGEKTTNGYVRRSDVWAIAMHTIKEALSLMNKMPIRHREKIDKIKIISSINNNQWEEISERINNLKANIKKEVREYIKPQNNRAKYERSIIV